MNAAGQAETVPERRLSEGVPLGAEPGHQPLELSVGDDQGIEDLDEDILVGFGIPLLSVSRGHFVGVNGGDGTMLARVGT